MAYNHAKFVSQLQAGADLFKEALINFGREGSENVRALTAALQAVANEGDFSGNLNARAGRFRSDYAQRVSSARIREIFDPIFQNLLRHLKNAPPGQILDVVTNWPLIMDYFLTGGGGPYTLKSRGLTLGSSASSSSGTGNGVAYRLTQDRFGVAVENPPCPCVTTLECVQDETGGAPPGEEVFSISAPSASDILDQGLGVSFDPPGRVAGLNSDGNFLKDASFQLGADASGIANPTDLGAWVDPTGVYGSAKYAIHTIATPDGTAAFMKSVEEEELGFASCLEIKGNHTIQQELEGLDPFTPYYFTARVRFGAAIAAGAVAFHWGNQNVSQGFASAGTFIVVKPPLDKYLFPYQFADSSNLFKIVVSALAGDTVRIDNVRFGAMTPFQGSWWFLDPGSTQWLAGVAKRVMAFTDTLAGSDSVIQRLLALGYGLYLNHSGGPNIADP